MGLVTRMLECRVRPSGVWVSLNVLSVSWCGRAEPQAELLYHCIYYIGTGPDYRILGPGLRLDTVTSQCWAR